MSVLEFLIVLWFGVAAALLLLTVGVALSKKTHAQVMITVGGKSPTPLQIFVLCVAWPWAIFFWVRRWSFTDGRPKGKR